MQQTTNAIIIAAAVLVLPVHTPAAADYIEGIDVSHWQGTIDWTSVKDAGVEFAFAKATQDVDFVDSEFHANMLGATTAGVLIGPYHFCEVDNFNGVPFTSYDGSPFAPGSDPYLDAVGEASHFLNLIQPYYNTGLHLPPVADVEGLPDFGDADLNRTFISNWVQVFSDTIDSALGARPIIYTSKYGANTRYTPAIASTHDLWLAWWRSTGTAVPPVPADTPLWDDWLFWQWTNDWSVPGISAAVDGDVFDGTLDELMQLAIGSDPGNSNDPVSITNFEADEGYFNWSPFYSGSNRGILDDTTAERITSEAQDGVASQQIFVDGDPNGWLLRHLSGLGSPPASPATNLPIQSTGSLGFWLKTDDDGVTVQIAVDDPDTGDRGVMQDVIADGRWHLYEWDLGDDSQWEPWYQEEGVITGSTVTIDSIQFRGAGDAMIFLDSIAHNPNGSLLPFVGDINADGEVDDLDVGLFVDCLVSGPYNARADVNGDGSVDGRDIDLFVAAARGSGVQAVPEPSTFLLMVCAVFGLARRRIVDRTRRGLPA